MQCPCGSQNDYSECCEPFIAGHQQPATAEELMRSRYTAFSQAQMDYILATHDPKKRHEVDMDANEAWARGVEWKGLEVLSTEAGGEGDEQGWVEFVARYEDENGAQEHRELSEFRKRKGVWYFADGRNRNQGTVVRSEPKVGRNDPCPCGSGKKYKKCCGAN